MLKIMFSDEFRKRSIFSGFFNVHLKMHCHGGFRVFGHNCAKIISWLPLLIYNTLLQNLKSKKISNEF